jgi:hypothetical protein
MYGLAAIVCASLTAFVSAGYSVLRSDEEKVTISGVIRNGDNALQGDASVRAIDLDGKEIDSAISDDDGQYKLRVPVGSPILRIEFDHKDWHVRTVEEISRRDGENSVINKVLPARRGPKTFELIVDQVLVYDRLRITAEFGSGANLTKAQLREKYGSRILEMPHPLRRNRAVKVGDTYTNPDGRVATALVDMPRMGGEQQKVIDDNLKTDLQRNVVNRLIGDLLFRYGYTNLPMVPAENWNQSPP